MPKPIVTVILTHHLDQNQPYLDLTTKSLCAQKEIDFEVMLISSAPNKPYAPDGIQIYHRPDLDNATKKAHWAVENCMEETEYFLFLSDDVMLSEYCIAGLVEGSEVIARDGRKLECIVNPMSNNENGARFYADMTLGDKPVPPSLDISDIAGLEDEVIHYPREKTKIIPVPWVSFFCTLISKSIWQKVGLLDERLDVRGNDVDFCARAHEKGIGTAINLGVFALHFGSKTLPFCTTEEENAKASALLNQKLSKG